MKFHDATGTCSLVPHIVLREAGLVFELVKVNLKAHQLEDGSDCYPVAPKGQVPLLELDNGERFPEGPAISQYIADQVPAKNFGAFQARIAGRPAVQAALEAEGLLK